MARVDILAVVLLAGCLTVADVPRFITRAIFRWGGADTIEERRAEGYMLTSIGDNRVGRGTVMGGWVERVDATNTRVIVVTKRRMQTSVFTALTETTFHRRSAETVESLKAGPPLQDAPR